MISLIVALATNNAIGRGNTLPWDLPDDLSYFRDTTRGHDVLMGRKCFESIGRLLPGRRNIILTRDTSFTLDGAIIVHTLDQALAAVSDDAFIIGGAEIYTLFLPYVDRLYLTRVHAHIDGDTFFPDIDYSQYRLISSVDHPQDARHTHAFTFQVWERV